MLLLWKQVFLPLESVRTLEEGPYGGTRLRVGNTISAEVIATLPTMDRNWSSVRIEDYSLAQTAYSFSQSNLQLPGLDTTCNLAISPLSKIAKLGLVSRDINGPKPRGPFDLDQAHSPTSTYPSIWNHNAMRETRLICEPDSQLRVRIGMEIKAKAVWLTRSRAHHNVDFRYNSQPLGVVTTEVETIGGRAWAKCAIQRREIRCCIRYLGQQHFGPTEPLVAREPAGSRSWNNFDPLRRNPPRPRLSRPERRATSDGGGHLRRVPRQGVQACLPSRRRPNPRPTGQARTLRPPRLRRGCLQGGAPPSRQMVRRTIRPRRQTPPGGCGAGGVGGEGRHKYRGRVSSPPLPGTTEHGVCLRCRRLLLSAYQPGHKDKDSYGYAGCQYEPEPPLLQQPQHCNHCNEDNKDCPERSAIVPHAITSFLFEFYRHTYRIDSEPCSEPGRRVRPEAATAAMPS